MYTSKRNSIGRPYHKSMTRDTSNVKLLNDKIYFLPLKLHLKYSHLNEVLFKMIPIPHTIFRDIIMEIYI